MIRRRGKNSWQVIVELPADPETGRRRQRTFTVRGSKKDAQAAETEATYERDRGLGVDPSRLMLREYLDEWLVAYAEENVTAKTLAGYRQIARAWSSELGHTEIRKLTSAQIQATLTRMRGSGLAPRTVLHRFRVLHLALNHACDWKLIVANPCASVKPPRVVAREMKTLAPTEAARLIDALTGDWQQMVEFTLATGMRLGEVLGLKWSDISFEPAFVQVNRSLGYLPEKGRYFKEPKTRSARRRISLGATVANMLRERRKEQIERRSALGGGWNPEDLVFPTADGQPQEVNWSSSRFSSLAKKAGFEGLRFHDLRHTAASLLLASGTNVKVVSEMLGHSTPAFTLTVYAHTLPSMHEDAAAALEAIYRTGRATTPVDSSLSIAQQSS